jgi:6-phospho-beta-galactosidase
MQSSSPSTEPFLWGVATSGYQSEGGYNGIGQPQNNWSTSEAKGSVMQTGAAAEFWTRYKEDFQRCQGLGLNSFRLGLEWARIQPSTGNQPHPAPAFDLDALDAYSDRVAACRLHGLEPIVTLHHFTHPAWLGIDAWLSEETIALFLEYVQVTVGHINRRLTGHYQLPPIHWYITINEPNILVSNTYLSRQFPAEAMGFGAALRAYNHLLTAHVLAYNAIHDLYAAEGWETPQVSLNTYCSDLYWSEKVIWDLLDFRRHSIQLNALKEYVHEKARQLEAALRQANLSFRRDLPYQLGRLMHWASNRLGYRLFELQELALFFQTLAASSRSSVIDFVAIDYYDPFIAHIFRLPSFSDFEFETKGWRAWLMSGITSKWWDWRSLPEGLHFFCQYYSKELGDRSILIAENGMSLRRKPDNSTATHRADQLCRSDFLTAHIQQIQRLLQESVPMIGYMHWSLTDNYEWGSYTPRFGLFSIDFSNGSDRCIEDHLGDRPAETYARLIQTTKAGFY